MASRRICYFIEKHAIEKGKHNNQIILGYAHLCEEEIKKGLLIMKEILKNFAIIVI
jgi:GntR family transcriptional regulator/MocR family aminotransferase